MFINTFCVITMLAVGTCSIAVLLYAIKTP